MQITTFQGILAWQRAHQLVLLTYKLTEKYPKHELFGLVSQSRRCGVSIASNIAEGFRRKSKNDRLHFYNMAQASLEELRYQAILARDFGYIQISEYKNFIAQSEETSKVLNGWVKSQTSYAAY